MSKELNKPRTVVHINVEHFTGMDEGDDGTPYYVASCDELHFVTDGETFEALMANIRECLILCLQDTDSLIEYNVDPHPKIMIIMELPENYAETA
jgi:predicted RNase H-like HicB family nuclease